MNTFDVQKSQAAAKVDLSRKGNVDEAVRELMVTLNGHPDLFTLSSCSGRIVVFRQANQSTDNKVIISLKSGCYDS